MRSKPYVDTLIKEVKQQSNAIQSAEDFFAFYQWMLDHQNVIQSLKKLDSLPLPLSENNEDSNPRESIEEPAIPADVIVNTVPINNKESDTSTETKVNEVIGQTFPFVKRASGGSIEEINYHLNEEIVRHRQIEHGNLILIKGIEGEFANGKPRYAFEIVDRTSTPHESLQYVTQGIVEYINNQFIVQKTAVENIELNGKDIVLPIQQRDIEKFELKDGDIIDGRFYDNSINSFRITYKYPIEDSTLMMPSECSRLITHRQQKGTKKINQSTSMLDRIDTQSLVGKRILLVGLASRKKDFQLTLSKYPYIQFEHLTGDERETVIHNAVAASDLVLINITENSHHATKLVTSICKELSVPVTSTSSDGLYMLLYNAKNFLEQIEGQKV